MTNVTKEEYWLIILNDPTQIGQITTEDAEFNRRINDVNLVLSNTFINSSDENLISRWETSLYIDEIEGKTITERKADILYKLCEKNYVPVSIIKRSLLNLIGDENKFIVEFIKDENELIVHTDRLDDIQLEAVTKALELAVPQNVTVTKYNHHIEISPRYINKYAACVSVEDMKRVAPDLFVIDGSSRYTLDVTSDGDFPYPLPKLVSASYDNSQKGLFYEVFIKKFKVSVPAMKSADSLLRGCKSEEIILEAPKAYNAVRMISNCPYLKKVTVIGQLATIHSFCDQGTPNLEEVDIDTSLVYRANSAFVGTKLNKESVLRIFRPLQSPREDVSKNFNIGIHIDHQNDEEVLAAIASAEAKGWTLIVQWNGTPTSAASTMAMGQLIYAKIDEIECSDGMTEQFLDWGHYVTDETGYETFRSLESAYKYFNLEQPTEN